KSAQIREILISESAWEEMTCLFAPSIVIFDDVLTAGSHFKAMKTTIKLHLPQSIVIGVFIARTAREAEWEDDLADDF
ncbi:hypothetical protein NXH38_26540, partial [Klebsiella quasipneumoniae]|nr:hypothetical protein [Klebsiella quasipneumoniae]